MTANLLSKMERKVVRLVALGCSVKKAAEILDRSVHTIDNHKTRAMRKLGVHNSVELTRHAIRFGISPLEDQLTAVELGVDQPHTVGNGPHAVGPAQLPAQAAPAPSPQVIQRIEVSHPGSEGALHPHAPRHETTPWRQHTCPMRSSE